MTRISEDAWKRAIMDSALPSRRQNKNRSGRTGRKQYNAQVTLQKVGGMSDLRRAIFAPADKALCVVVPRDTGMRDGIPFRSPGLRFQ